MGHSRFLTECTRLKQEHARNNDEERRSWSFTLQTLLALLAFGLGPLVPHSNHLFGAATVQQGLLFVTPAIVTMAVSFILYRRDGAGSSVSRTIEAIEIFFQYSTPLSFIFVSGLTWSILWVLCPFSGVFGAITKPFHRGLYTTIFTVAHSLLAAAFLFEGKRLDAGVAVTAGVLTWLAYLAFAKGARRNLWLQAERNVMQVDLSEARLDLERDRIAHFLGEGVGKEIAALVEQLEAPTNPDEGDVATALADKARAAFHEFKGLTCAPRRSDKARFLSDLARMIDDKCRPLCDGISYLQSVDGEPTTLLRVELELPMLRVAQELVRNAVVHGAARRVAVDLAHQKDLIALTVRDDGVGLSAEAFARATGGLRNAHQWLDEQGGHLELAAPSGKGGTQLRAAIPLKLSLE